MRLIKQEVCPYQPQMFGYLRSVGFWGIQPPASPAWYDYMDVSTCGERLNHSTYPFIGILRFPCLYVEELDDGKSSLVTARTH